MKKDTIMNQGWKKKSIAILISKVVAKTTQQDFNLKALAKGSLFVGLSVLAVNQGVIAQEVQSTVTVNFKADTIAPPVFNHIAGTNKIIVEFTHAAAALTEDPGVVPHSPVIERMISQKDGDTVRILIDTKGPVKYSAVKAGNNYRLVLVPSIEFKEEASSVVAVAPVAPAAPTKPAFTYAPLPESFNKPAPVIAEKTEMLRTPTEVKESKTVVLAPEAPAAPVIVKTTTETIATPVVTPPMLTPASVPTVKTEIKAVDPVNYAEVEHINLKADANRSAKLTIDLSDKSVAPIISRSGNLLLIDLPNTKIPVELQRSVPTQNLGTITQNMDVATQNGVGRVVLAQGDNWTYTTYQMDKKVVVEIKPNTDAKTDQVQYKGKPLTLNFQNMDVRAILQVLADFSGLNIMTSDSVSGSMTIRLKDVPWDQALDLVLEAKNLQKVKNGNVVWIATRQEIADKNKTQLELNNQASDLAPLKLEFFQLNHYKAKEMKDILEGKTSGSSSSADSSGGGDSKKAGGDSNNFALLSKRGTVGVDVRNNSIFVQDTDGKLEEIAKIIKRLDVASKQVLIEAKLVVVDDTFERDLGAQFGFGLGKKFGNTGIGLSNNYADSQSVANNTQGSGTAFSLPVTGGGSLGFTILNAATGNLLSMEISALEQNNRSKVLSNPRLLTEDNKKAEIRQGTEIPYVTPGAANSPPTVSFKDAVLSLGVTPQISANGRISMDLDISKDTVGQLVNVQGGGQVPSIDTRKITTQVTVNDGQTVVLGGIYEITSRDDLSKVPLLGDIPWVGNLFKNTTKSNEKVELLIFITPHIITDSDLDAIDNDQAVSGQIDLKLPAKK